MRKIKKIFILFLIISIIVPSTSSCGDLFKKAAASIESVISDVSAQITGIFVSNEETDVSGSSVSYQSVIQNLSYKDFDGENAFEVVNNNVPFFTEDEITTRSYERYGNIDDYGRCTTCMACVGVDLMPKEKREDISSVHPTGWYYQGRSNNKQYDFVDGGWIYNRCHLIGFQLTGENANENNLITGTRFLNIDGMLSFENMIADVVKEENIHVMYRVTPVFKGSNMICDGLLLEGYSVEDEGETIEFCVFSFNVQPGIEINYKTGENSPITH